MARVVVVGGGLGGAASAARLAKLGHDVSLVEARPRLGGALDAFEQDGFAWENGPTHTLVPAVLRDLFRKSGRALEREVELVPFPPRRHVFEDGTTLDLPGGSRAAQLHAVGDALGDRAASSWVAFVDAYVPVWEALRKDLYERPWSPVHAGPRTRALLRERTSLHKHLRRSLADPRLRAVVADGFRLEGHDPRDVPAWQGMSAYLEQEFSVWTVPGGLSRLADVLAGRLATRGVTVVTGTAVTDVVLDGGRAVAVRTELGTLDADQVVLAVDPRGLPSVAGAVARTTPALPPLVTHLGITGEVPDVPPEVTVHGDGLVVLRTGGAAPAGAHAWTVLSRGRTGEDVLNTLWRAGIRVRDQVEVRVELSPRELVQRWHGSPYGVLWQGRSSFARRLGPDTPWPNVHLAGAHTRLGAGVHAVGLSAALVAQRIGPADRTR
ncbi:MAG: phytoene desaturase family protein [Marmoricola sp.]